MLSRTALLSTVLCLILALSAAPIAHAEGSVLAGSEWRPTRIGGSTVPQKADLFVQFRGEGKISGHGGCNRFFGSFRTTGSAIKIGPLASTRMACPPEIMKLEAVFLAALEKATTYRRDGAILSLRDARDDEVAALRQADWD